MSTQGDMKTRIQQELRRNDLTTEIANAINSALLFYKYERFPTFNTTSQQAFPASDSEAANPWMNDVEPLIRTRAKAEIYSQVIKQPEIAKGLYDLAENWHTQLKLSATFQTLTGITQGTQAYMKARIANELEKGYLPVEIANAITAAIQYYQKERFYWNETREITWNTVANQYVYTSSDDADLGNLIYIDYVFAYIGGQPYRVIEHMPEVMEWLHLQSPATDPVGQPFRYTWYAQTFRLYPTPDQAYPMRIGGTTITAAPANDSVTGNVWMNDAEVMIRSRAKFELYTHVPEVRDPVKAAEQKAMADDAFSMLKSRSNDLDAEGNYTMEPWGY